MRTFAKILKSNPKTMICRYSKHGGVLHGEKAKIKKSKVLYKLGAHISQGHARTREKIERVTRKTNIHFCTGFREKEWGMNFVADGFAEVKKMQ